ncbi:hypothetical protein [Mycobacteroides salmoniphilum]|uniref:Uncharacterized protein n=1 Tax=Mycobacteroides salmoniphilum TaxID=404941 RepID=A0A4R8SJP5_9MYCO|nr:hypothetical protein [Mycobacteroides salmoniphilum]TDZ97397.1 hypothetical protein CCUG60885_00943 [Mycobacteroides salmoniphilum]TEA01627.1 hypothetical protein CCUG60883_04163 [Mycobacteroides salmoniphilum]
MPQVSLSAKTVRVIESLFPVGEHTEVAKLLAESCSDLPLWTSVTPEGLERLRFAVLRYSCGVINELRHAIDLANIDWRDLLVNVEFGDSQAHVAWFRRLVGDVELDLG